jgi:hypothetical protein
MSSLAFSRVVVAVTVFVIALGRNLCVAAPAESTCSAMLPEPTTWTEQEHWAWNEICLGRDAYLGEKYLTAQFLRTVLLQDPYRKIVSVHGIRIVGGRFREFVDLGRIKPAHDMTFLNTHFEDGLSMASLRTVGSIWLTGSTLSKLDLRDASVGDNFEMNDATVRGDISMRGLEVGRSLSMREVTVEAEGTAIDLAAARIGKDLDLAMVTASKRHINMDSLNVGGHLFMRGEPKPRGKSKPSSFKSAWLVNAHIGGQLDMSDAIATGPVRIDSKEEMRGGDTRTGELKMDGLKVGRDLKILNPRVRYLTLRNAEIGGNLMLDGPEGEQPPLLAVDLSGTTVGRTLSVGSADYGRINWSPETSVSFQNLSVQALQDGIGTCSENEAERADTWPNQISLIGFSVQQLFTMDGEKRINMAACSADWWLGWLARQKPYSPAPYEMLSSLLLKLGYPDKARDILYAGKDRELEAAAFPGKIWRVLDREFIGYGYYNFRALYWITLFVLVGALVLRLSGEGKRLNMPDGLVYSIDMLLPIIKLREANYHIELQHWARYYFYLHKIMGFILASFLLAGLSGLTR